MAQLTDKQLMAFAAKQRTMENGCIEWTAAKNADGYGEFMARPKGWRANRLAWTLAHGDIPAGLSVLHRCDNPGCVNPAHLFLGTQVENMADCAAKGRSAKPSKAFIDSARRNKAGEANTHRKLTATAVLLLRRGYMTDADAAAAYGVTTEAISQARRGVTWKHI